MLAEARGYHFGMVLAHQNLTQMPRDTQLAVVRQRPQQDLLLLRPGGRPPARPGTPCPNSTNTTCPPGRLPGRCRLVVDGRETPAFTLRTNPPRPVVGEATAVRQAAATAAAAFSTDPAAIARLAGISDPTQAKPAPDDDDQP